jgi:hypothetical protein
MFIRKRDHNKPLAGILLVVFLLASAFTQTSGTLSLYVVKALGSSIDKSKQASPAALQFPCGGSEKEEKKADHKSLIISFQDLVALSDLHDYRTHTLSFEAKIPGRESNQLFLLNKSLRL